MGNEERRVMSKLREYRQRKGVKQIAVAKHLGVSRTTYAKYETQPELMSVQQARSVCSYLGCKWGDIFLPEKVK